MGMRTWRNPLLPIGLLLVILGCGNWYAGKHQIEEHERLLATGDIPAPATHFEEFRELTAHTTATLLSPLQHGSDQHTLISGKLDFYKVVQSGGRMLILLGLFCAAAGMIRTWYQQRAERGPAIE
jgi:uncharacterized membrane protein YidH (DUF202 family)